MSPRSSGIFSERRELMGMSGVGKIGIARGCGRQKIGAFVNLGAYYFVGIPCAIILTFVFNFGGKGLWMGIISGISVQALLLLAITLRTDWEQQARKARDRVNSSSIPLDMGLSCCSIGHCCSPCHGRDMDHCGFS